MKAPMYFVRRSSADSDWYIAYVGRERGLFRRLHWERIGAPMNKAACEAMIDKYHSELPDTYEYVPKEPT